MRLAPPKSGPFDRRNWPSPLRGPWMASVLSLALLVLFGADIVTGYLSYVAYQPELGANSLTAGGLDRHLFGWTWPTSPAWLYAVTQGIHILAGVVAVPILAAKLWTVMPKFYKFPPARSPAEAIERGSLGLLVGSSIFLLFSGLWDIAYFYDGMGFNFVTAHFYAAWIFVGSFLAHVAIKTPVMLRARRERGALRPLRAGLLEPEPYRADTSAPLAPGPGTVTRRGMLGLVGGASLTLAALLFGQSFLGGARRTALLAPRGQDPGSGPNAFQVNKTAAEARVDPAEAGEAWRLRLEGGPQPVQLTRADLLALPQVTHELPINCVEGWSTLQTWTGVPLRDLARRAGMSDPGSVLVESFQGKGSVYAHVTLSAHQAGDARTLLALAVNGTDLSLDHGFPARLIVPNAPGVHNTKWVGRIVFS